MRDDLGTVDLTESSRAKLLKLAIDQAEADCSSCVVRHAEVYFVPASVRVRERRERESKPKILRMTR